VPTLSRFEFFGRYPPPRLPIGPEVGGSEGWHDHCLITA